MATGDDKEVPTGEAWENVLASLCRLQKILPDAVLVGGTASALYAGHRFSFDHDHVLIDLRDRFDAVLEELESVSGWETARIKRPVLILGSLDGVETGIRQLRRARPLETAPMTIGGHDVLLPTLPETLRIKAFLCLDRNATRDYLDLAALASNLGITAAVEALWRMDELYPQKNGDTWAVRTQLIMQLAVPPPYDLEAVDLSEYKGVKPPFDHWADVAEVCGRLSDSMLETCLLALASNQTAMAELAKTKIDDWRDSSVSSSIASHAKLPGLKP